MSHRSQILTAFLLITAILTIMPVSGAYEGQEVADVILSGDTSMVKLDALNYELSILLLERADTGRINHVAVEIEEMLSSVKLSDTLIISDAYYFLGHYYLTSHSNNRAVASFGTSVEYRNALHTTDRRYALGLSNMALALFRLGDYSRAYDKGMEGLYARRALAENDSSVLAVNYLNLSSICLEMNDSEKAIAYAEAGLRLTREYPTGLTVRSWRISTRS